MTPFGLLKPKFLSARNRWVVADDATEIYRDLVLLGAVIIFMGLLAAGTHWILKDLGERPNLVTMAPGIMVTGLATLLAIMTCFSSISASLGSLFFSESADLLQGAPIPFWKIWLGRTLEVAVSTLWMPIFFLPPILIPYWTYTATPLSSVLIQTIGLGLLFFLAVMVGMLVAIILLCLSPLLARRGLRGFLLLSMGLGLVLGISWVLSLCRAQDPTIDILRSFRNLVDPEWALLPSSLVGNIFSSNFTQPPTQGSTLTPQLLSVWLLACWTLAIASFSFLILDFAYLPLLGLFRTSLKQSGTKSRSFGTTLTFAQIISGHRSRTIAAKDLLTTVRDLPTCVELMLLLALTSVYLSHLQSLLSLEGLSPAGMKEWSIILLILSSALGAFLVIAISTRFLFPSISKEGRSFWIIRKSPINLRQYLLAKKSLWFPIIAIIGVGTTVISAIILGFDLTTILVSSFWSLSLTYGITALAVGFGAKFARFEWEHPSELIASFGSFVFMIVSVTIALTALITLGLMINFLNGNNKYNPFDDLLISTSILLLVHLLIQLRVHKIALGDAVKALENGRR